MAQSAAYMDQSGTPNGHFMSQSAPYMPRGANFNPNHAMYQPMYQPMSQPMSQPTSQPVMSQPMSQPVMNQPVMNQPANQVAAPAVDPSTLADQVTPRTRIPSRADAVSASAQSKSQVQPENRQAQEGSEGANNPVGKTSLETSAADPPSHETTIDPKTQKARFSMTEKLPEFIPTEKINKSLKAIVPTVEKFQKGQKIQRELDKKQEALENLNGPMPPQF